MAEQQTQLNPAAQEAADLEDIANSFRGEAIADEVDKPPAKKKVAKESVKPEPIEEPEDKEPEAADEIDDEDDEGDGRISSFEYEQLKNIASRQRGRLDNAKAELETLRKENAELKKRSELSVEGLYDEDVLSAMSPKERKELAAYLFYMTETDKADDETKMFIRERQDGVRRRKAEAALKAKEDEISKHVTEAEMSAVRREYFAETRETIVDMSEDIPSLMETYGGDRKMILQAVVEYAERMIESGLAESNDDVNPATILAALEETAAKRVKKQGGTKLIKATQKTKGKALGNDIEMTEDEENEYLASVFRK